MPTAIVDTLSGANEFVDSGHAEDARFVKLTFSRNPDPLTEKWDGNLGTPGFLAKTPSEVAAAIAAQVNAIADARFERALAAVAAALERNRTGAFPTAGQAATIRGYFVTAWKALG